MLSISSPGFYGRIFVVLKSSGAWRPVLDLSALKKFLKDSLPDGDSGLCQGFGPPRRLGDVDRSFGFLLPHSHSSSLSEVAPLCMEEQGFQSRALPFYSPLHLPPTPHPLDFFIFIFSFYQGGQGAVHLSASGGHTSQGLSGRLADPVLLSRSVSQAHPDSTGVVHETGFLSQHHQIGSLPSPAILLPRHPFRQGPLAGPTSGSLGLTAQSLHLPAFTSPQCLCQSLVYAAGPYGVASSPDSSGLSSQARSSGGL